MAAKAPETIELIVRSFYYIPGMIAKLNILMWVTHTNIVYCLRIRQLFYQCIAYRSLCVYVVEAMIIFTLGIRASSIK